MEEIAKISISTQVEKELISKNMVNDATKYTRMVFWLKIMIGLSAGLLFLMIFVLSYSKKVDPSFSVVTNDVRIGLKYHYNSDIAFKINWGVYHQFLTTANNQDENLRLVELWLGIPEDKDASISQHLIGGAEYMSPQNIFYRLELT